MWSFIYGLMEANNSKDFSIDFFFKIFFWWRLFLKSLLNFSLFYASVLCFSILAKSHVGS